MKTKRIIAAVFAFAIAAANFSVTAFAAEEEIQTDVSTEATVETAATETTVETTATDVTETTEAAEENTETTTETVEDENTDEDTTIIEDVIEPSLISGETFTIGDESFNASIESGVLKIYNDRGLAFEKRLYGILPLTESIALRVVDGNILNIKEYGDGGDRLLHDYYVEYNSSTGKFGDIDNSQSENYSFNFQGVSFYANITRKMIGDDQYNYLSINFADGNPTSIQNEVVWIEYGRTGGFGGYSPSAYITISGDQLIIHRIMESGNPSKDILTTYVLDKDTNKLVKSDSTSDTQEVTEQMLLDKFTAQYGTPLEYDSGDFNNDGVLDMYCSMANGSIINTYFVTMNSIILVSSNSMMIGGSIEEHGYFTLNDGNIFRFTLYSRASAGYIVANCSIEKINNDGTLSPATINGEDAVLVLYDDAFPDDHFDNEPDIDFTDYITHEQAGDPYTFFSANGDSITINRYIFDTDNDAVDSTNYTYDAANNAFVVAGSTNNSGNSSTGSTSSVSSSPATSDNFSVIPFTLSIALVAGSVVGMLMLGLLKRKVK